MTRPLDALLGPKRLEEVQEALRLRQILRFRSERTESPGELLNWEGALALMDKSNADPELFRFFLKGRAVDPGLMGVIDRDGKFSREGFRALANQGISVVGRRLDLQLDWCARLAEDSRGQLRAAATLGFVASYGHAPALSTHYDKEDLIILQLQGSKRWNFYGTPIPGSGAQRSAVSVPVEISSSLELSEGDVLVVPAGQHHSCVPLAPSLHLGILLAWPTGHWLVRHLMDRAMEDEVLSEPVRSLPSEYHADLESRMKDQLKRLVDELSLEEAISLFRRKHFPADGESER